MTVEDLRLLCRCYKDGQGRCGRRATREDGRCDLCRSCSCSEVRRALPHLLPRPDPACCACGARRFLSPEEAAVVPPWRASPAPAPF